MVMAEAQDLVAQVENLPQCEHPQWTLGCERCFTELKAAAAGQLSYQNAEQGHLDVINGATLFGMHIIHVIAGMENRAAQVVMETLDLRQRDAVMTVIANIRNLSAYITGLCQDPMKLEEAMMKAALIAAEQVQLQKDAAAGKETTTSAAPVTPSGIVLTDL